MYNLNMLGETGAYTEGGRGGHAFLKTILGRATPPPPPKTFNVIRERERERKREHHRNRKRERGGKRCPTFFAFRA